ncbi:MAG TPA: class D sortase [Candidatus Angelobacter sp.]|nr:class D sortase [Candidatus Angelobacter sp.]
MKHRLRTLQRGLVLVGTALLLTFVIARGAGWLLSDVQIADFREAEEQPVPTAQEQPETQQSAPNFRLWAAQRLRAYRHALSQRLQPPLAVLRIPSINLEVPVLRGTGAYTLNTGAGLIPGTAAPGTRGNIGLAGHRDGFFRGLKDLRAGDTIELRTHSGTDVYVVTRTRITNPRDLSALQQERGPALTLVTCYPFYAIGKAPQRFIVQAELRDSQPAGASSVQSQALP